MPRQEASAGAVIFRIEDSKILFLLLLKKYKTEYYDLVKGNVEKGESAEETARREAVEEAGLTDLRFLRGFKEKLQWWYRLEGKLTRKTATYFLAETRTSNIRISGEHTAYLWASPDEAEKLIKHKETRDLLRKAAEFIKKRQEGLEKFMSRTTC